MGSKLDELSNTTFGRFGIVEESIAGIKSKVNEVATHIENADETLNKDTVNSLQQNETVLRDLSEIGGLVGLGL